MNRLFLRIAIGIMLTLALSSVITGLVFHGIMDRTIRKSGHLHDELVLTRELLDRTPLGELDETLSLIRSHLPTPVALLDIGDDDIPGDVRQRLREDGEYTVKEGRDLLLYATVRGGERVLVMGPRPFPPPPPGKLGRREFMPLVAGGITLPLACLVGFILAYPMVTRLRKLEDAAARIQAGDLAARAEVVSRDAVGSLAGQFNRMADEIQLLLESQRHLMQAVSHELRTPISRIEFLLEMIAGADSEAERKKRIGEAEVELEELDELVGELLLYMRFESPNGGLQTQPVDIDETLTELARRYDDDREAVTVVYETPAGTPLVISAYQKYFKRAVGNLLKNAVTYAESRVVIGARKDDEQVVITVSDDGPGLSPENRKSIFEPFTRTDTSRSRESGGVGLGLAIVRRIVAAHGGTVRVEDNSPSGACFITTWPAA